MDSSFMLEKPASSLHLLDRAWYKELLVWARDLATITQVIILIVSLVSPFLFSQCSILYIILF